MRNDSDAKREPVSRRSFVIGTLAVGTLAGTAGLWIEAALPRPAAAAEARNDPARQSLTLPEWKLVEAITARILPTDDTPGAVEAGCVNFIDKALAHEDASALPLYQAALSEFDRVSRNKQGEVFGSQPTAEQDRLLSALEVGELLGWRSTAGDQGAFFQTLRMHTLLGFVLDPSYGGNRDYVGWKTMGFPGTVHHLGGSRPEHMVEPTTFVPVWKRSGSKHSKDR